MECVLDVPQARLCHPDPGGFHSAGSYATDSVTETPLVKKISMLFACLKWEHTRCGVTGVALTTAMDGPPVDTRLAFCLVSFLFYFSITVYIQNYFVLVAGIQRSGQSYTLHSDLPDISGVHLAPHLVITLLLTILPMLYLASLWLFCNCRFVLNPFTFSLPPTTLLPSGNQQSILCIYESASILFVYLFCSLDSTYKWNYMVFVFSFWLISLSIISCRSIHDVANGKISLFFMTK